MILLNAIYWYRIEQSLGRNSLVGTTVRTPENIPENLGADEKHTCVMGEKTYVATTVGLRAYPFRKPLKLKKAGPIADSAYV